MRVGVLGAGQLGRMIALAGYPLGLRFRFLDHSPDAPAGHCGELVVGEFSDQAALAGFADGVDVVTYEFENVPVESVRMLERRVPVRPGAAALEVAQDRFEEKRFFLETGMETAPFAPVGSDEELRAAVERTGLPAVLKTRRLGYDGKGQVLIGSSDQLAGAWQALGAVPAILEGFVRFDRELSLIAVRSLRGEEAFYPLVENEHARGILRRSLAPAAEAGTLQALAERHGQAVLESLDYVGVLAIEFFQVGDHLLANEMAPRVHNSGHWSIEGAHTSQFENHLRAVLGMPLGSTAPRGRSAMLNLIGSPPGDLSGVLAVEGAHPHLYGKSGRPGRKVGHVTVVAPDADALAERLARVERALEEASGGE